jgi:hypothetical protein
MQQTVFQVYLIHFVQFLIAPILIITAPQLSNAIEPFLQTGSNNSDVDNSQYLKGKYHPQPSIGLVRSQGPDNGWGANSSSFREGASGITLVLTEAEQANIHAALNRALVHIAR